MAAMAREIAMALDPVQMARAVGIISDEWQAKLLRSQSQRILLNCSRQIGKSTVAAVLADHMAFYEPGAPILLLSPSQRQSQELFRKCLDVYRALDRPIPAEAETALHLELVSSSRIIALPGKEGTIRGISGVKLLIIDEASRVPDSLYMAVRPMLAVSGGRIVLSSTPFGTRGFYYDAYLHRDEWDYYEVPATECPRIEPEFLEEERRTMGDWWFEQEYMCKFLDAQSAAFRAEDIERIVNKEMEMWSI
jgi:hypothetical protein